jgi:hypothetical protein
MEVRRHYPIKTFTMNEPELLEKAKDLLDRHGMLLAEPRPGRTITDTSEIFMMMDPGKPVAVFNAEYDLKVELTASRAA